MLKKYFDWTPSDLAAWEKIRAKGLRHFILWFVLQNVRYPLWPVLWFGAQHRLYGEAGNTKYKASNLLMKKY